MTSNDRESSGPDEPDAEEPAAEEPAADEPAARDAASAQQRRLARLAARLATLRAQRAEIMRARKATPVASHRDLAGGQASGDGQDAGGQASGDGQDAASGPDAADTADAAAEGSRVARPFRTGFFGALGVAVAYVAYLAIDSIRDTLIVIAIAAVVAIGLEPAVQMLIRRGFRRGGAVATVFLLLLAALFGAGYAIVPPIVNETIAFVQSLPRIVADLQDNSVIADLDERFHIIDQIQDSGMLQQLGGDAADRVLTAGLAVAGVLLDLAIILILTLFFLAGFPRIKQATYRLAPASRRPRVAELGDKILGQMGGYLAGMTLVALQAGIVAGVFAAIIGLPYPWAIALGATILDFVPVVGPVIIGISMTLLGFTQSLLVGIIAGLFYLVQHMFEAYWLYPRVMRHQVHISTASVVVAILVGAALLGVPGALLAVPVAAGVQLIIREVVIPIQDRS